MKFYNFTAPPFRLVPERRFFFGSRGHNKALAYLKFGLQQGEGFIVVTGDVGAGKSTLVSRLFAELDGTAVAAAFITTTQLDAEDALRLILAAFKIEPIPSDKASMLRAFESYLEMQSIAGRRVLLAIDEAQGLPMRTLEELRMLSNILINGRSVFQCFMLGQPQFMKLMVRPDLEQFRQRVVASCHLGPLFASETCAYIEHRLKLAGWAGDPAFTGEAFRRIHDIAGGIPRRINTFCSRLLFYGALEQLHDIDEAVVDEVIKDLSREAIDPMSSSSGGSPPDEAPGQRVGRAFAFAAHLEADVLPSIIALLERLDRRLDHHEGMLRAALKLSAAHAPSVSIAGQPQDPADGKVTEPHATSKASNSNRTGRLFWPVRRNAP